MRFNQILKHEVDGKNCDSFCPMCFSTSEMYHRALRDFTYSNFPLDEGPEV